MAKLILDSINPKMNKDKSMSMSTKLFNSNTEFSLNQEDFPPLPSSIVNVPNEIIIKPQVKSFSKAISSVHPSSCPVS